MKSIGLIIKPRLKNTQIGRIIRFTQASMMRGSKMELTYITCPQDDGRELLNILRSRLRLSMSQIRKLKRESGIFGRGEPVYTSYRVSAGELVSVFLREAAPDIPAEKGSLDIVYEDDWFLILNKPRGVITHPSRSRYSGTLMNFALKYILDAGGESCHAVNRLDRDTSGLVLIAKSGYAKALCGRSVMEKRYMTLVLGVPDKETDEIRLPIRREREREIRRIVAPDGDAAVTRYQVIKTFPGFSLLELILETGRTHQIRVHLSAIGHPVLGDKLYGTPESLETAALLGMKPHMLHASRLRFTHPITEELLDINCPPDWLASFDGLRV
jgi:RluA family pseudouridine synthase